MGNSRSRSRLRQLTCLLPPSHQNDPFTRFLDPDQFAALQGATTGELTGVGLEIAPGKPPGGESGKEPVVRASPCAIVDCPIAS